MRIVLARCVVFLLLCSGVLCGGCATYNYSAVVPRLDTTGTGRIVVLTHDQRPYIVAGNNNPAFVGLLRSPVGIPWPVSTQSGRPLADDVTEKLCHALTDKGFQCTPVFVAASAKPNEIRQKLQEYPGIPALVLVLHEWKSDTHTDTTLVYDATMRVLDPARGALAEHRIQGRDVLGGTFWNASSFAQKAIPQALKKNLEELLNEPTILTALQTVNRAPVVAPSTDVPPEERQLLPPPRVPAAFTVVHLQPHYDAFRLFVHPHTGAERLTSVAAGVPLKVIETREHWLYVETPEQHRGWILREWMQE